MVVFRLEIDGCVLKKLIGGCVLRKDIGGSVFRTEIGDCGQKYRYFGHYTFFVAIIGEELATDDWKPEDSCRLSERQHDSSDI